LIVVIVALAVLAIYVGAYSAAVTPVSATHDQTYDDQFGLRTVDPTYPLFQPRHGEFALPYLVFDPIHWLDRRIRTSVWPDPVPAPRSKFKRDE
jgi:hypothetical protein